MPKGMTMEAIKENEKQESLQMQQGMYTYLLRKADDFTVTFQDVDRTNALLKKAGLLDNLDDVMADLLCSILKVDAIIKSNWSYAKTGSEAGAIASAMLLGVGKGTGSGQLVMQINGAKDGEPFRDLIFQDQAIHLSMETGKCFLSIPYEIHFGDEHDFEDQIVSDTQRLCLQPKYLSNQVKSFLQKGEPALFYLAVNNVHSLSIPRQLIHLLPHRSHTFFVKQIPHLANLAL
jgi:hypothetical protein